MILQNLIWIDLETTGLDVEVVNGVMGSQHHDILEIGIHITDSHLNIIDEGLEIVIGLQPDSMSKMGEWCLENHTKSGLVARCEASEVSLAQAEDMILDYLAKHGVIEGESPMAGNTIRLDYNFVTAQMQKLQKFLSYRQFDVTMFKMATALWDRDVYDGLVKKNEHRALADIKESIEEMRLYKDLYFNKLPIVNQKDGFLFQETH